MLKLNIKTMYPKTTIQDRLVNEIIIQNATQDIAVNKDKITVIKLS
jgi:hypothetical protein